ncbi:MAG TPA: hypothetical protein PLS90_15100 [Candidatus Sumerlaeota bacterium]|nr:MAG: hypothetical protein BWZ08_01353 [candidate division BRC1 bacterium ADurb.BinA292]HOE95280.1 hypothetical protein [Candidatus Sumerlaeota bacterium]HOR28606.1 hypothetical protein [Candidatus Sumerlaeota bacterium]HPK03773.1 hypothetical protein [Candidatus Sumerlaeota bacterium]
MKKNFLLRWPPVAAACVGLVCLTGCISLRIGTDNEPPDFKIDGIGSAYATVTDIPAYDGTVVRFDLFRGGANTGELASFYIWPLGGLDLGLLGARLRLLPLEMGAGTLFYQPGPVTGDASPGVKATIDAE